MYRAMIYGAANGGAWVLSVERYFYRAKAPRFATLYVQSLGSSVHTQQQCSRTPPKQFPEFVHRTIARGTMPHSTQSTQDFSPTWRHCPSFCCHGGGGWRSRASASSRFLSLNRHQRMYPTRVTLPNWSLSRSPPGTRAFSASLGKKNETRWLCQVKANFG